MREVGEVALKREEENWTGDCLQTWREQRQQGGCPHPAIDKYLFDLEVGLLCVRSF